MSPPSEEDTHTHTHTHTTSGWGYNFFKDQAGELDRKYRMRTYTQAPSVWDGEPSCVLDYTQEKHYLGRMQMRDEVREVVPGLYLGVGAFGVREAR